ncbi:hypothetical protein SULI_10640 [Saccharolobus solfataricus]|uniref:Uncharacterized protein n=2 Tax=Saccharolobus solfataricus TaxID=2287 RepID=A0A0E3MHV4_SACSO|nr:hypothetical protein [Saccharolobus solfataricus]AKA75109.1 hypothetical protein SULB_2110 [Saccharolobus solfataricus]AKA77803.1 hypothetical protein SULC_2108 [Saccharolobus solfataricus]AKA80497.1 hypothetical protein SULA_2109 [Saccharolobus solfataricus]AZF69556.1 hypothetical protein SULG_10640 [Saccharolobus solfataricus]AZF72176.1 hypothetical protein SULH_10640 [Saccharolobus solfataricus]
MLDDKEILLSALDKVDKFYVYLAGINSSEILLVTTLNVPNEIEVEGKKFKVVKYHPEDYLSQVVEKEDEIFRKYKIYYFVKAYMRKILDTLSSAEVERMSLDLKDNLS